MANYRVSKNTNNNRNKSTQDKTNKKQQKEQQKISVCLQIAFAAETHRAEG
jgi:hypothetical protein